MASGKRRLATNAPGEFYVDSRCIDCGACRRIAPASFSAAAEASRVHAQPLDPGERLRAEMALLACPVAAIGTESKHDLGEARAAFPAPIEDGVHYCGWHAESSYGAASYLIVRPGGNVLVDSPRFTGELAKRIAALGGVQTMFLTHCDDVADHAKFAARFGCRRILHRRDVRAGTRSVEVQPEGTQPVALDDELLMIPVPGHTRGSMCLLYRRRFLFAGDHLVGGANAAGVAMRREVCWYDWDEQRRSMQRLAEFPFEWVLSGHGPYVRLDRPGREGLFAA